MFSLCTWVRHTFQEVLNSDQGTFNVALFRVMLWLHANQHLIANMCLPVKVASFPGQLASFPGQLALFPGQLASFPGQLASFPGQLASFPGQLASFPGQLASFPGQLASFPGQLASFPGQLASFPGLGMRLQVKCGYYVAWVSNVGGH